MYIIFYTYSDFVGPFEKSLLSMLMNIHIMIPSLRKLTTVIAFLNSGFFSSETGERKEGGMTVHRHFKTQTTINTNN